ncbi:MAG: amino acid adenylation domain-containing protein [Bacteroidales bacterium]|nr:amino acid adenylation domain-containing protein [Bacteroidales bacterium]
MKIKDLLSKLYKLNIKVIVDNNKLKIQSSQGKIPKDIIEEIKQNKSELLKYLSGIDNKDKFITITKADYKEYYPLSSAQKRMFLLQQMNPESMVYNVQHLIPLSRNEDIDRLRDAFEKLIDRHENFRTSFKIIDDHPVQQVHEKVTFKIHEKEIAENDLEIVLKQFVKPFIFSEAPLFRVQLVRKEDESVLMLDMHHIISDGTSFKILTHDFFDLIKGKELIPLKLQYKDFSEWQNSKEQQDNIKSQKKYWVNRFSDELPILDLPTDYPRSVYQSTEGASVKIALTVDETNILRKIVSKYDVTLFMALLSAFKILLSKISGQNDIIVGVPLAGRRHSDLDEIVGVFINTLPFRSFPNKEKTLLEFFDEVKSAALQAFENQDFQFEDLVEKVIHYRDTSRNPIFDVSFNLNNISDHKEDLSKLEREFIHTEHVAKLDLHLIAVDCGDQILLNFEYCTKLFSPKTIERFIAYFKIIVQNLNGDFDRKLSDLSIITKEEKNHILFEFNKTKTNYPKDKTIIQLFKENVIKLPVATALIFNNESKTFLELDELSNSVAIELTKRGVESGQLIGLMIDRSIEMIIGILGILKAGAAYLPMDPLYPEERNQLIIEKSEIEYVLVNNKRSENIKATQIDILKDINFEETVFESIKTNKENLAYVIYTSGSTGEPKGVMIDNQNVVNFVFSMFELIQTKQTDTLLSLTTVAFDIFGLELFVPLLSGAKMVLGNNEEQTEPRLISKLIEKHKVNILQLTPSRLKLIIEEAEGRKDLAKIGKLLVGGEEFPFGLYQTVKEFFPGLLYNMYGPTETTIWSAIKKLDNKDVLNIGKPIGNTNIYILNEDNKMQAIGIAGELCISGDGVGKGYFANDQLTHEKFISDPFIEGETLYKTGDLARWLSNGELEFIGRIDNQVKIRGYRIEIGEIENSILKNNEVKECVVIVREDTNKEKYLCAYLVINGENEIIESIKETLMFHLPEYMIPSFFINVDAIPLTANGKIDRKKLPIPKINAGDQYIAPSNDIEKKLTTIWAKVLNISSSEISINANFFNIGGHSLKASILAGKIHKEFGVEFILRDMFLLSTIKDQAKRVQTSNKKEFNSIPKAKIKEYYNLSSAQKSMYFLQLLNPESISYNMPGIINLNQNFKKEEVATAFKTLVLRHESFQTCFMIINDVPIQQIQKDVFFEIQESTIVESELQAQRESFVRPFDLGKAPLLRVEIVNIENSNPVLMFDLHHIISDGTSNEILKQDFLKLMEGEELEPLTLQYKDFCEWQNSEDQQNSIKEKEHFWINQFSDELPILNLPTDYSRPPIQSTKGAFASFVLSKEETKMVRSIAKEGDSTLFMALLSIYNILLSKLSGQDDIVIGTPIASRLHSDLEGIVGMFINTLPLRNYPSSFKTVKEFLQEVKQNTLLSFDNQEYQFEDLVEKLSVERDTSRNPVFDVMFNMFNMKEFSGDLSALDYEEFNHKNGISKFDLTLTAFDYGDQILLGFEYCTKLFKPQTIEQYIRYFRQIVQQLSSKKSNKILEIDLLSLDERKKILFDFNDTKMEYPVEKSIKQLFEEQVKINGDRIALIEGDNQITNFELNKRANQMAGYLVRNGVKPQTLIAICEKRSIDMIVGMLAIIKTGGIYIPLDPNYPSDRLNFMLKESNAEILITKDIYKSLFSNIKANVICPENHDKEIKKETVNNLKIKILPDDITYIIYTSGSTGNPKGVMGKSKGIINRLYWLWNTYPIGDGERSCQKTSVSFVDHVAEIFSSLLNKDPLYIFSEENTKDIEIFIDLLDKYKITRTVLVPSFLKTIISIKQNREILKSLKYVFCSGEALNLDLAEEFYKEFTNSKLINVYGSSEVSADATYHEVTRFYIEDVHKYFKNIHINPAIDILKPGAITMPNVSLDSIANRFKKSTAPDYPISLDEYNKILYKDILPFVINSAAPQNIGHMTSALPDFVNDFSKLISQLNQNLVKIETSKSLTFVEREALAILHRLFYSFNDEFYSEYIQTVNTNLGIVSTGGTTSNISAMLAARNKKLLALDENNTVMQHSIYKALEKHGYDDMVIIGSRLMHYSIKKSASILGMGTDNIIYADYNKDGKLDIDNLRSIIIECNKSKKLIIAIVAIAGTTETGEIDPLVEMGELAKEFNIHFHVDAAWGGATMFSEKFANRLNGIELSDSITFCGHKQLYLPQGISVCLFKDPKLLQYGSVTANYQATNNSFDTGRFTIEGSRSAISMSLHASLHLIGKKGYASLIEQGINSSVFLSKLIETLDCFELIMKPQLNIVCYRYIPEKFRDMIANKNDLNKYQNEINEVNLKLQNHQFYKGETFVSKTTLTHTKYAKEIDVVVLRVVLSNPLTTYQDIFRVLENQMEIANELFDENNSTIELEKIKELLLKENSSSNKIYVNNGLPMFIGKPLSNLKTFILDDQGTPVPMGISGELCVSGDGLSRGYLNQPELTHEKFVENKLSDSKIFKTGDMVRHHKSGNIEFLRRIDHQVKIRGFRIELNEIENCILELKQVKQVVVIDREDDKGEKFICAYFVAGLRKQELIKSIRDHLSKTLPDYMIPLFFIELDFIPLTPNGKINRKALPVPKIEAGEDYAPPTNELEKCLTEIWSEILNIDANQIGIEDNFFTLGGHSLRATLLISKIHKKFEVKLRLIEVFQYQTIKKLSDRIQSSSKESFLTISKAPEKSYYNLSSAQKRIYFLQQLNKDSIAYNLPGVIELSQEINKEKITQVIDRLIERHESFRTSFEIIDEQPVQKIHDQVKFNVKLTKIKDEEIGNARKGFVKVFDLSKAPLLRVEMFETEGGRNFLLYDMHHIISDGVSHVILKKEFSQLSQGIELPSIPLQYKDFSEWQNSETQKENIKAQESFWVEKYSGEIPKLELPYDYNRPSLQSHSGASVYYVLTQKETSAIKSIAKENDATLFMVLLAVFNIMLSKLSGSKDIIIGTPVASRRHSDLEGIIGMFVNTLALRNELKKNERLSDFIINVKNNALEAFDNQECQFEDLIDKLSLERDISRNPLFDVMFNLLNHDEFAGELKSITNEHFTGTSKFDLNLTAFDFGDQLLMNLEYCTKLFKSETIDRFIIYFKSIVKQLCANSDIKISEFDILVKQEKQETLIDFNKTVESYPKDKTIIELIENQASITPLAKALIFGEESMNYQDLMKKVNSLAVQFIQKGIGSNDVVAILISRSEKTIITLLAVLKAGGAYLPIDLNLPLERKKYIIENSNSKLVVLDSNISDYDREQLFLNIDIEKIIKIEEIWNLNEDQNNININYDSGCLAYIIYTSGTTGKPKGVMIENRSLVNYIWWAKKVYVGNETVNFPFYTSVSFDLTVTSIFTPLISGNAVVVYSDIPNEILLNKVLNDNKSGVIKLTPSHLKLIRDDSSIIPSDVSNVKRFIVGGEQLETKLANEILDKYRGKIEIFNEYGPTEATVGCMTYQYKKSESLNKAVPIGIPAANSRIYLLDEDCNPVPKGVCGELYIGGDSLARGYIGNQDLTDEKFVENSILNEKKLYKTGDLAKFLCDGNLEFIDRIDEQIKIRGYRVELKEIENCLLKHPDIKECVTIALDKEGEKSICSYIVLYNKKLNTDQIKDYLFRELPAYMIPAYFVELESIPLTGNGKVDKKDLPWPEVKVGDDYEAPTNKIEEKFVEVWSEVLGIEKEKIGIDANFFELGGHSLFMIKVVQKITNSTGYKLNIMDLFRNTSIRKLANYIEGVSDFDVSKNNRTEEINKGKESMKILLKKTRR